MGRSTVISYRPSLGPGSLVDLAVISYRPSLGPGPWVDLTVIIHIGLAWDLGHG